MFHRHALAAVVVAFGSLCFIAPSARAEVKVGDKPTLDGKSATNQKINLTDFSGKIVVVDFWATWCGPCMAEAPHMVELNKKYAPEGVQYLGVSLDSDPQKMLSVAKESHLDWPHIFGGAVWESPQPKAWGVHGIPHTFVLSPEGIVLWSGHPASGLEQAIKDALKQHPPMLVDPKVVEETNSILDHVNGLVRDNDVPAALRALSKVNPAAAKDKKVAAKMADVQGKLSASADKMLAEVDPLLASKQYVTAIAKLRELSAALAGTPAGTKAKDKLSALASDPEARKQIELADKTEKAYAALAAADKLKSAKKDALAYQRYKEVVSQFGGTDAATTATAAVAEYEKDPAFVKNVASSQNETKAKAALGLADSYKSAGNTEQAKKKYKEVVEQYPGTPQAVRAKEALADLGK